MSDFHDQLYQAARQGNLILTANKRLSRHLHDDFDQRMLSAGKTAWDSPQIFSFEGWLLKCLGELGKAGGC